MSSEWKTVSASEYCLIVTDGTHDSPKQTNEGHYLVTSKHLSKYSIDFESAYLISSEDYSKVIERSKVDQWDILFSMIGTIGRLYQEKFPNPNYAIKNVGLFKLGGDIKKSNWLIYYLQSPNANQYILSHLRGSTQSYISLKSLRDMPVSIPPTSIQNKIVSILSSIDEKIELNNKINDNLEQMAQAIFKSWFIDFEPFKNGKFVESELGEIPIGWQVIRIGDLPLIITDYVANGSFASLKENVTLLETPDYAVFIRNVDLKAGNFNKYVDEHSYRFLSKSVLFGGEVIISNVGDVGSVFLCPHLSQPMTLGNNIIMLTMNGKKSRNYFFYLLFKHSYGAELIKSITGGSAQPKFNKTDFRSLRVIMPPSEIMDKFIAIIECLFQQQANIEQKSIHLTTLRDILLPHLMSGKIDVSQVKI